MDSIIRYDLPDKLHATLFGTAEKPIASEDLLQEFAEAQRAAIKRFCEAVKTEAQKQYDNDKCASMDQEIAFAMKKLRNELTKAPSND